LNGVAKRCGLIASFPLLGRSPCQGNNFAHGWDRNRLQLCRKA
jgi:hypothetical protein